MFFLIPQRTVARGIGGSCFPGCVAGDAAYGLPLSKYPVQWVAPEKEAAMFYRECLYPKIGYKTMNMMLPRQYMKHATNDGTFFASWRYVETRQMQASVAIFMFILWVYLALGMSGGSTNKSWRGHHDSFWFGEKHQVLLNIEELQHNLGRMNT